MAPLLYNDHDLSPAPTRSFRDLDEAENNGYNKVYGSMKVNQVREIMARRARYSSSSSTSSTSSSYSSSYSSSSSSGDMTEAQADQILRDNDIAPRYSTSRRR